MKRLLPLLIGLGGLAGCNLAPVHETPALPVPARFPAAGEAPGVVENAVAADAIAWRDYFAHPALRGAIELALANNRDLRIAALNIEAARATYRIQDADRLPSLAATASQNAQRIPADLSGGETAEITRPASVSLGFTAFELDFFGRVRNLRSAALDSYLASAEARRSAQISLVAEVARLWLALAAERERLALAERTRSNRAAALDLIRRSQAVGAVSGLDLRQAETLLEAATVEVARAATRAAQAGNALDLVVGAPLPAALHPVALSVPVASIAALPAGLPAEVLTRRPDILAAELRLRAANANIGAARAAFFPSIQLTASAGTASASLGGLFEPGSGAWAFLPQIRLPLFEAGRLRAGAELARVQRDLRVAEYEQAIQVAFREVADALAERARLAERLAASQRLRDASAAAFELAGARHRAGLDSYLGLLDAQRALYAAEQDLIESRQADAGNRVTVYKVLGGGGV